jgi:hypothetical protein
MLKLGSVKFLKEFALLFIIVPVVLLCIFFVLGKSSYMYKSWIINSIPRYPKANYWDTANIPGKIFVRPEIHHVDVKYIGDYQDVLKYFTDYFIKNNFVETTQPLIPKNREKLIYGAGVTYHDSRVFTHKIFKCLKIYLSNYNGIDADGKIYRNDVLISL